MRFMQVGTTGLLVELADLETTIALLHALHAAKPEGVLELVPAARTVLIRYDGLRTSAKALTSAVMNLELSGQVARSGRLVEIPVVYDGEDRGQIADMLGMTDAELIRRHTDATYTVAFCGFAPGFAYMACDDPAFDVPRRKSPRVRVPAGTVALAGTFAGIYPTDSPGGWQLLGTTPLRMWDTYRAKPALLVPGDTVRFRDLAKGPQVQVPELAQPDRSLAASGHGLRVMHADLPALFQDAGRSGRAAQGISISGAMDRPALRKANLCVGNPPDTPAIEVVLGGFELEARRAETIAVTGAPRPLSITSPCGRVVPAAFGHAIALDRGDALKLGTPTSGMRSYIALRGGFQVDGVLGSASRDTLAKVGPDAIVAGSVLEPADAPATAVDRGLADQPALPHVGETVTLDIIMGPRSDWFTAKGISTLLDQKWQVTADSGRIALRLAGNVEIERISETELASEGIVRGAIQVPHSGQPVVFLSDHPLTGGYPVIAVIADHHLDLAGQIPIGAWVRFHCADRAEPGIAEIQP